MSPAKNMKRPRKKRGRPRTRLRVEELLGERTKEELRLAMGLKFYTQIYPYLDGKANPTLLMLERLSKGLSALSGRRISVADLLDESEQSAT
jgi:hypothetical protein